MYIDFKTIENCKAEHKIIKTYDYTDPDRVLISQNGRVVEEIITKNDDKSRPLSITIMNRDDTPLKIIPTNRFNSLITAEWLYEYNDEDNSFVKTYKKLGKVTQTEYRKTTEKYQKVITTFPDGTKIFFSNFDNGNFVTEKKMFSTGESSKSLKRISADGIEEIINTNIFIIDNKKYYQYQFIKKKDGVAVNLVYKLYDEKLKLLMRKSLEGEEALNNYPEIPQKVSEKSGIGCKIKEIVQEYNDGSKEIHFESSNFFIKVVYNKYNTIVYFYYENIIDKAKFTFIYNPQSDNYNFSFDKFDEEGRIIKNTSGTMKLEKENNILKQFLAEKVQYKGE